MSSSGMRGDDCAQDVESTKLDCSSPRARAAQGECTLARCLGLCFRGGNDLQLQAAAIRVQRAWRKDVMIRKALWHVQQLRRERAILLLFASAEHRATVLMQHRFRLLRSQRRARAAQVVQARQRGIAGRRAAARERLLRTHEVRREARAAFVDLALARGTHRAALTIQRYYWRQQEARVAAATLAAERLQAELLRRARTELKGEQQAAAASAGAGGVSGVSGHPGGDEEAAQLRHTLTRLPVRKKARLWPHAWETKHMSLAATPGAASGVASVGEALVWSPAAATGDRKLSRPAGGSERSLPLRDISLVAVIEPLEFGFAVTTATRVHCFRAASADAMDAWLVSLAEAGVSVDYAARVGM